MNNGWPHSKSRSSMCWLFLFIALLPVTIALYYLKVKVAQSSLRPRGLYSPWNSPGRNTGVGSLAFLQGIFPTQELNTGLPHCRWILYQLSHKGSPRILEWVAYPFSSGSSQPRNRTGVSCLAGGFFTSWAIRKAPYYLSHQASPLWPQLLRHASSHIKTALFWGFSSFDILI